MLKKLKINPGFTLIEVVIVIAIGALIILVVLQAVGSAQRNQRDSARRSEAARISGALEQYAANNGGRYPANNSFSSFLNQYEPKLGTGTASDPGKAYQDVSTCTSPLPSDDYEVKYEPTSATLRDYTLFVCLEQGEAQIR